MKNTRIERLKHSKRVKKATKVLTVGLLICPLAIGAIKALADEVKTIPTTEQTALSETIATTNTSLEQQSAAEESSSRTEVEEGVLTEAATSDYDFDELNSQMILLWLRMETLKSRNVNIASAELIFDKAAKFVQDALGYPTENLDQLATWLDELEVEVGRLEAENPELYSVSYTIRGNGSLSNYPVLQEQIGTWIPLAEMPIPTAGAGSHFKGWEVNGHLNGEWGVSNTIFSGFFVTEETVVTAVFETGELDWSRYIHALNQYLGYINLKPAYDEFGFTEEYDNCVSLYNYYVDFKAEKEKDPYLSQEELDRLAGPIGIGGIHLNLVDRHFFFDDNITPKITDYFNSLKTVYDDSTTYTSESKQAFNKAWVNLQEALNVETGWAHEIDGGKYTAYQALKTAEQNLVKAEIPSPDKAKLEQAIKESEAKLAEGGWKDTTELETVLATAKEVLANTTSTQTEIDTALSSLSTATSALEKEGTETPSTTKLESSIKDAESKLTESGYTEESMKALRQALQNAKDVLANTNSTQAEIDEAQKALDLAIAGLVKAEDPNSNNTGNNGSNGTGNSTTDPNTSNNGTNNNNSQNSTTTTKPAGNNTNKDGLPQTGEQSTTNVVIAGLSLTMLSILTWFMRKKV